MENGQPNMLTQWVPTAIFWGAAYFLFTHGYKKSALTLGAIGLATPILAGGGALLYLKNKGYFNGSSKEQVVTASSNDLSTQNGYMNALLQVT